MSANALYIEARNTLTAIQISDYPKERKMRAVRSAMRRCVRRKVALMAEHDKLLPRVHGHFYA